MHVAWKAFFLRRLLIPTGALLLISACVPLLEDNLVENDPNHDFDGDGFTEVQGDCDDSLSTGPNIHPNAQEVCDGVDNNCNEVIDDEAEDAVPFLIDADNDGYGRANTGIIACEAPEGYVAPVDNNDDGIPDHDCNDDNALINPGASESCNTIDDNCDGIIDPPDTVGLGDWYLDVDGDSFGANSTPKSACEQPEDITTPSGDVYGYVLVADSDGDGLLDFDCDDYDAAVNPSAEEICDGRDNDCDTLADDDDDDVTGDATWYPDTDNDGFGDDTDPTALLVQCEQPAGYVLPRDLDGDGAPDMDCDDALATVYPRAIEVCDTRDNNCDGLTDEGVLSRWHNDDDGDGYGDPATFTDACEAPDTTGYSTDNTDCDDDNAEVHPNLPERCNGLDDNCDGLTDGADAIDTSAYYIDKDADGFGEEGSSPNYACTQPANHVTEASDCDDSRAGVNPQQTEKCATAYDDDCDGSENDVNADGCIDFYLDADGDNYGEAASKCRCEAQGDYTALATGDCDDANDAVRPGVTETCATAFDDDCDGDTNDEDALTCTTFFFDADGDGYGDATISQCTCDDGGSDAWLLTSGDCADDDGAISPAADERCTADGGTPVDEDCDGQTDEASALDALTWYADSDGDGYGDPNAPIIACEQPNNAVADNTDCDDNRDTVNPAATETCATPYDDDCDGDTNDQDALTCNDYYLDSDGDGYGDGLAVCTCEPTSTHTATQGGDCDEDNTAVNPAVTETCATPYDDDCDGDTNDEDALTCTDYYLDSDGDEYGTGDSRCLCADEGLYTATANGDCDESTSAINPGADERCTPDGGTPIDEDCDGQTDEASALDALTWYADSDGDTYGDASAPQLACEPPADHVGDASDCDDGRPGVNPAATETCATAYDDDCDGDDNNEGALECIDYWEDVDSDGFGINTSLCFCTANAAYTATQGGDCDDALDVVNPGETETCATAFDDDCNGSDNDEDAINCTAYFADTDGDGYGIGTLGIDSLCLCQPTGSDAFDAVQGGDCNDDPNAGGVSINPGADELCDGDDNDCDGQTDEEDASDAVLYWRDVDGDGFGTDADTKTACTPPVGYAAPDKDGDGANDVDCDDGRQGVHPDATETCATGFDDDCDGNTNDEDATGCSDWYYDSDYDAHGTTDALCLCSPEGYYTAGTNDDCDDTNNERYPGNTETCATAFDDDCDGDDNELNAQSCTTRYYDEDGDDYGITGSTECRCTAVSPYDAPMGADCNDDPDAGGATQNPGNGTCGLTGDLSTSDAATSISGTFDDLAVGDFNGDGWPDLAVGQSTYDTLYTDPGGVFIFYGPLTTGPFTIGSGHNANVVFSPEEYNAQAGKELAVGDFDGDGRDDLIVSGLTKTWRFQGPFTGGMTEASAEQSFPFGNLALDIWPDWANGLPAFSIGEGLFTPNAFGFPHMAPYKEASAEWVPANGQEWVRRVDGGVELSTYATLISPEQHYQHIAAGNYHTCAISSAGEAVCWGNNDYGQASPPNNGLTYQHIAAGRYHTCAISSAGEAVFWGINSHGIASPPNNGLTYQHIAAGHYHICAISSAGEAVCWGQDSYGQASPPNNGLTYQHIAAGDYHTCAISSAGEAVCWGQDNYGQASPPNNGLTYQHISAGYGHTCAISSAGEAVCWGHDLFGEASPPDNGLTYQDIAAGGTHTCAISSAGEAVCWGRDADGQASPPNNGLTYQHIAAGGSHTCAISSAGDAVCWGSDSPGWGSDSYSSGPASPPNPYTNLAHAWTPNYDIDRAALGDFNGDGYPDLVLSDDDLSTSGTDPYSGPYTIQNHGKIWIIPGSASGFTGEIDPDTAEGTTIVGESNCTQLGQFELLTLGDINNDGSDDLGLSFSSNTHSSCSQSVYSNKCSKITLFYGPLTPGELQFNAYDASFPCVSNTGGTFPNISNYQPVYPVGDINNDDYDDFFVGGYLYLGQPN